MGKHQRALKEVVVAVTVCPLKHGIMKRLTTRKNVKGVKGVEPIAAEVIVGKGALVNGNEAVKVAAEASRNTDHPAQAVVIVVDK